MPEIKNTFLAGKMNKDLDERLVPNNQYIDAVNVGGITSREENSGTLQNSLGNLNKSNLSGYITNGNTLGSCVDKENDKIYWFIKSTDVDIIAEYDFATDLVVPVLVDYTSETDLSDKLNIIPSATLWSETGNGWTIEATYAQGVNGNGWLTYFPNTGDFLKEGSTYELTYVIEAVPGVIVSELSSRIMQLDSHGYGGTNLPMHTEVGTHTLKWIQGATPKDRIVIRGYFLEELRLTSISIKSADNFLNFQNNKLITGVNILDGMLFWTDNNSEPKKINIERCKAGSYNVVNATVNPDLNWEQTTKNIDAFNSINGNITEEDITVIKRYPLHAPKLVLRDTIKEPGLTLKTSCVTPLNTSYDYNEIYWGGNSDGGGSGDIIEYKGYVFGYLAEDIYFSTGGDKNYYKPQMTFDGLYFNSDNTDIDYATLATGNLLEYPWHRKDPDTVSKDDKGPEWWVYESQPSNAVTNLVGTEYEKRAYSLWGSLENSNSIAIVKPDNTKRKLSSGSDTKDLYGDRFYLKPTANVDLKNWDDDGYRMGEKGDMVVFYDWFFNNNHSFWTYLDGEGTEHVKPPGTSNTAASDSYGVQVKDTVPNIHSVSIQDHEEHFLTTVADFGTGWTVGDGADLGASGNYAGKKILVGAAADTTTAVAGPYGLDVDGNGFQHTLRVITGFKSGRSYLIKIKVKLKNLGDVGDYSSAFGISQEDDTGALTWIPLADTDSVFQSIHASGSGSYVDSEVDSYGWRLGANAAITGGPNDDGVYVIGGLLKIENAGTTPEWEIDENELSINLFKRNNAVVDVLSIEANSLESATVKTQEFVFEPKPDYEVGDVIKMTNTTKSNTGDDINVTIRLVEENTTQNPNQRALTWANGHQKGTAIFDTSIAAALNNVDNTTNWTDVVGNLTKTNSSAQKTTSSAASLLRFTLAEMIDSGDSYLFEYEVSGHDHANPEDSGYLFISDQNKYNTNYATNPVDDSAVTANYDIQIPFHNQTGVTTKHYATFTARQDIGVFDIKFSTAWTGTIENMKLYPLTKTEQDVGNQGSNSNRKVFNAEIVNIDDNLLQLSDEEKQLWDCELQEQDPIYENIFPRFAYRWKYKDNEYSAISAFTEVGFLPGDKYSYDAKHGYNLAMTNHVKKIILRDFQKAPKDVVEIDILYKQSDSNNVYTITTIKRDAVQAFSKYEITKEQLHALVESKQMLRPYDNVPRKAKSQEITANRLLYGNYTQQYDVSSSEIPIITAEITSGVVDTLGVNYPSFGKSVKSIRNYQVGISYLDKFGRQSPVFSNTNLNANSLLSLPQSYSKSANSIVAKLENNPPDWVTHYKFFVKDASNEYYNISLDRFYQGENESHFWLSFGSADINKIREDDYLILKKQHDSNVAVHSSKTLKYKVIAKQGSPPDFLRIARVLVGDRIDCSGENIDGDLFSGLTANPIVGDGLEFASQAGYGGSAAGYPLVGKSTFRLRGDIVESDIVLKQALLQGQADRYIRIGRNNNSKLNDISNYYEVLSVTRTDGGGNSGYADPQDYYEFTLVKALNIDASFVGTAYVDDKNLFLEYYGQDFLAWDSGFIGKFFVKVLKDDELSNHVARKQRTTDAAINIVNVQDTNWGFIYENNAVKNTNADKGQDTDNWLYSTSNFWWKPAVGNFKNKNYIQGNNFPGSSSGGGTSLTNSGYNSAKVRHFHRETVVGASTSQTGTNTTTNPFTTTWAGTIDKADWSGGAAVDDMPQKFIIDQAWAWNWPSIAPIADEYTHFTSQDPGVENVRLGPGFVIGNKYCAFRFIGIGNIDANGTGTTDDSNTWSDEHPVSLSVEHFDNYDLLKQLTTVGTKFRWSNDPSQTIYTITGSIGKQVYNYKASTVSANDDADHERENQGYRIYLQLDKTIVWSPTATITSGQPGNLNGTHVTMTPYTSGAGNTSKLEILEYKPSETTYTSENPAVFEVEPKERADLNLYHEVSGVNMVLKNGMYIEALNNSNVNDEGGNYHDVSDVGTIYKPGIEPALPYDFFNFTQSTSGFPRTADRPRFRIMTALTSDNNPNKFCIDGNPYSGGSTLPEGITIRISERDDNNFVKYFKDYILPKEVSLLTGKYIDNEFIVLNKDILGWHNCFAFGNGVESNRIRDDYNAVQIDKGPRVSTTLEENYAEEVKPTSLIYSGIYNGKTNTNKLNEFIQADKITKELNPEYGSIQKLFTRNTNVVIFCEDKILKVLANKNALYNADGNPQLLSSNAVLGGVIPFIGEYGISKNPESFANFGYRVYFSDQTRGAILRLSQDGLTPISDAGMSSYFTHNLSAANNIIGSYCEKEDCYNINIGDHTVAFVEKAGGWSSFKSFLPESGASLNGVYYTFYNGDIWKHHTGTIRNNFYGIQYQSSVKFVFNGDPSMIKSFNTINYEGTQSREYDKVENTLAKKGWFVDNIETDKQSGKVKYFKEKEGKWFNNIIGVEATEANIDTKEFTSQGLGLLSTLSIGGHPNYKTLNLKTAYGTSNTNISIDPFSKSSGRWSSSIITIPFPTTNHTYNTYGDTTSSLYDLTKWVVKNTNPSGVSDWNNANWLSAPEYHTDDVKYYVADVITGLQSGHTYSLNATVANVGINAAYLNTDIEPYILDYVTNYNQYSPNLVLDGNFNSITGQFVVDGGFDSVTTTPVYTTGGEKVLNNDFSESQLKWSWEKGDPDDFLYTNSITAYGDTTYDYFQHRVIGAAGNRFTLNSGIITYAYSGLVGWYKRQDYIFPLHTYSTGDFKSDRGGELVANFTGTAGKSYYWAVDAAVNYNGRGVDSLVATMWDDGDYHYDTTPRTTATTGEIDFTGQMPNAGAVYGTTGDTLGQVNIKYKSTSDNTPTGDEGAWTGKPILFGSSQNIVTDYSIWYLKNWLVYELDPSGHWTTGDGWKLTRNTTDGTAFTSAAECDGTQTTTSNLTQSGILVSAGAYDVGYEIEVTTGSVVVNVGGSTTTISATTNTISAPSPTTASGTDLILTASSDFVGKIIQVSCVGQTTSTNTYSTANWSFGTNWEIEETTAGEFNAIAAASSNDLTPAIISGLVVGTAYQITWDQDTTSGDLSLVVNDGTGDTTIESSIATTGSHVFTYTPAGADDTSIRLVANAFTGTIDNFSIVAVNLNWTPQGTWSVNTGYAERTTGTSSTELLTGNLNISLAENTLTTINGTPWGETTPSYTGVNTPITSVENKCFRIKYEIYDYGGGSIKSYVTADIGASGNHTARSANGIYSDIHTVDNLALSLTMDTSPIVNFITTNNFIGKIKDVTVEILAPNWKFEDGFRITEPTTNNFKIECFDVQNGGYGNGGFNYAQLDIGDIFFVGNFLISFDYTRTSGELIVEDGAYTQIGSAINASSPASGTFSETFNAGNNATFSPQSFKLKTYLIDSFIGTIENLKVEYNYVTGLGEDGTYPELGFSAINMADIENTSSMTTNVDGNITCDFKFVPEGISGASGISILKGDGVKGDIYNITCVDVSGSGDIGINDKWGINTSSTSNTSTVDSIQQNYVVNSAQTVSEEFYIHSKTVSGIRYAVRASNFSGLATSDNAASVTVTLADTGVAGAYANTIKVTVDVVYDSGNLFPSTNDIIYLTIQEINDGVILATDQ